MSWLRIDDQFVTNGKLGELSDPELRALLALWAYCSRRQNQGVFYERELKHALYATPRGPRCVTTKHLERFCELSLVVPQDGAYLVNDWRKYQPRDPTSAERQRAWRERNE
jgi:hypothetical protein